MISREIPSLESKGVHSTVARKNMSEPSVDYGLEVNSKLSNYNSYPHSFSLPILYFLKDI